MKHSLFLNLVFVAAGLMLTTGEAKADLMVGDPAPKLHAGKWIQGEPVAKFDTNHIYVVEFWATWCGPCREAIPHLNALWEKFRNKNVIVIGQDIEDNDKAVAPFVAKMGTNMTYRVALDDKSQDSNGAMLTTWMGAAGLDGVPTAFIINKDGVIAWIGIGYPMTLNDQLLNNIISGHYDLAKASADYKKEHAEDIEIKAMESKLFKALRGKNWDDAQSALDGFLKTFPKYRNDFADTRLEILLGQKKFNEAYEMAESLSNARSTDEGWQNLLAWRLCSSDQVNDRTLVLAEKLAERAVQLTAGTNSGPLDTLARVQFMLGKKDEAVATEERAANIESAAREKSYMEKTLASYQEGILPIRRMLLQK